MVILLSRVKTEDTSPVGVALSEAVLEKPGEKRALPTAAGLRHTIDGLDDFAYHELAVLSNFGIPGGTGREAIDDFPFD